MKRKVRERAEDDTLGGSLASLVLEEYTRHLK